MNEASPAAAEKKDGCTGLIGLAVMLFGALFLTLGIGVVVGELRRSTWDEVPCVVERFEIRDDPEADEPFAPEVVYRYDYGDRTFTGARLRWGGDRVQAYEDLAAVREELRAAEATTCRVNPEAPEESVLLISGGDLGVGALIAVVGGVIVTAGFFVWRSTRSRTAAAVTERRGDAGVKFWLPWFFGGFAAIGLVMLFGFSLPMARDVIDMRGWEEVPAESLWSRLREVESDDGTTYRVDVFYRYEFDGREYRSNRWDAAGGSSSGSKSKREIVKAHRKGTDFRCFVDPDKPWRAVVHREPGWGVLFAIHLPHPQPTPPTQPSPTRGEGSGWRGAGSCPCA